ncbi:hypothetical protein M5K25_024557 [Dendrobium thyrsiflorum]|uniref:Uncharacterized protein n=1 Tax=Dendrobium thyrsiflorum TaxID=117978 RepID=A0ABD0U282_DENTH
MEKMRNVRQIKSTKVHAQVFCFSQLGGPVAPFCCIPLLCRGEACSIGLVVFVFSRRAASGVSF